MQDLPLLELLTIVVPSREGFIGIYNSQNCQSTEKKNKAGLAGRKLASPNAFVTSEGKEDPTADADSTG